MDFIKDALDRQQAELQERLSDYEDSVLLASHNGEIPSIDGFTCARVSTVRELVSLPMPCIAFLGDDEVALASSLGADPAVIGVNMVRVKDLPSQNHSATVDGALAILREVSFIRVMNDIADQRLIDQNQTEAERLASQTKREESTRRRRDGTVKPLIDFDRGFTEPEADDNDQ